MGGEVYRRGFTDRLAAPRPIVLDGALGTELERHGARCDLPLWSARALLDDPELVARVHREHVAAGAEIVTANTFRTQRRTLAQAGLGARAVELTSRAVALARDAAGAACFVAGSIAPLEDCWRPDLVPDDRALAAEHAEHARALKDAGADLLLIETMNTIREALAAARAAAATGVPFGVSFACDEQGRLLSGEPLARAIEAVAACDPDFVAVNCAPPAHVRLALPALRQSGRPFGAWANLGAPRADGSRTHDATPAQFAAHAIEWVRAGARIVGGCCGTTPAHVRAIAKALATHAG